ncbi:hypothetical protein G6F49_002310 [Rhizopus delemar]|nr:hypothetical protein G6F49_002310 [Rhizopus delemar]
MSMIGSTLITTHLPWAVDYNSLPTIGFNSFPKTPSCATPSNTASKSVFTPHFNFRRHSRKPFKCERPKQGSNGSSSKEGHRTSPSLRVVRQLCQPTLYCPQKVVRSATSLQLKGTQPVRRLSSLQDGNHPRHIINDQTGRSLSRYRSFDAFLHLHLHPSSRKYLRFVWQNRLFQFRTTPFGLNIVPFWFTKTTRLIVQWARQQGIRLSAYLDDWIIMGETKEIFQRHLQKVLSCLRNLGWLVNDEKSNFEPSPTIEHLGFVLNTITMQASLPGKKLRDIQRSLKQLFQNPVQTPRRVQGVIMRLQAATFAVFPARLSCFDMSIR